ncbi:TIGR00341 family protein [Emticicia sp. BO119]|uniref:TIGR00341 family protein n=1 Tax=Emticicia sp. BO119 TaxID=2757768 RepID=UPI0015F02B73|nr:TIGR00341 family protein [Emticicia sp. BO119]MBA4849349.1 TIGR00341 family protein [Emticicia sp. BO119]
MKAFLAELVNLHKGEQEKNKTLIDVKRNISFRGTNLWALVCAIIIASVGLNINSTAVIIGAMLISPLMGPIVGTGFALGIYDFDLLKRSLKNLMIATIVSLIASTVYFFISPFKEAQSELLARTSPNIYDVMIAFFGGLVGVISITRVEKGNPIPGVAIATALMPPLCTAGFGLANGKWTYFFGAFYLYFINCVFICISTLVIVKYLKYPVKEDIDERHERQVKYSISFIIIIMLLPSAYFAYSLFEKQQFEQRINTFIEKEFTNKGQTVIYKKSSYNRVRKTLELAFLADTFTNQDIKEINRQLLHYGLLNTKVIIRQNTSLQNLKSDINNEISKNQSELIAKQQRITLLEKELKSKESDSKKMFTEANVLFPTINSLSMTKQQFYGKVDTTIIIPVLIYQANRPLNNRDLIKLSNWVKQRNNLNNLKVLYSK